MKKQGQFLKRYIRRHRLTQAELARRLSISPSHLSKVLSGERELGKYKVAEASRVLGVPMETFFQ
jgi:transcriptional regulator with XRE-family HTH domain